MAELKTIRKQCSRCKDWRVLADFHKEQSKPLGLQSRCKLCKKLEKLEELAKKEPGNFAHEGEEVNG